jgi:hypothetical protein
VVVGPVVARGELSNAVVAQGVIRGPGDRFGYHFCARHRTQRHQ